MKKLGLVCLSISLLLFSCSSKNIENNLENQKVEAKKSLTIGYGTDLDPYTPISNNEYILPLCGIANDTLVKYDNGKIVPCLAESWEIKEEGRLYLFHLRDDVKFHDGSSFNAETAAECLNYYKDYEMFGWMKGVSQIVEAKALDEFTLSVEYQSPYYGTLYDLTSSYKIPMVSPSMIEKGNYETMKAHNATGPYKYDSYVKGDYTKFVKNENYWGESPLFDEIIVKFIPDSGTRLKALQSGEIDLIFSSIFISYDEFKQATSLNNISGKISDISVKTRNIVVNSNSPLLKEKSVREAIALTIDKESLVKGYTYSYEEKADTLFSPNLQFCDVKMNSVYDYNVEKAAEVLENSGWKMVDGVRVKEGKSLILDFTYPSDASLNKEIVSAIASSLNEIGIKIVPRGLEFMSWYMEGMEGKFDLSIGTTYGPPYDPQNYLTPMLDSLIDTVAISGLENSDEFFNVLRKSTTVSDENTVRSYYDFMLNFLNDNIIEIPLSYQKEMIIYRNDKISDYDFGGIPTEFNPFGLSL